jgi:hypothetical protein
MKHLATRIVIAVLVALATTASQVHADYLNWTYTANPNVPGIAVNAKSPTGGATVTLTDFNNPQAGASKIPVIAYVTSTAATTPVSFGPSSDVPPTYKLALKITDSTTHDSGTLNFTGSIAGSLTATTSSLVNTLTPVTSKSLTLDGHTYTVTIRSVALAAPTSPQQDIFATVSVSNASTGGGGQNGGGGHPGVQGVPEPTSLLLAGLSVSLFGLANHWRSLRSRVRRNG